MNKENDKKLRIMNDKKNVIILVLVIIVLVLIASFTMFWVYKDTSINKSVDASNFSSSELLDMLYGQGYKINISKDRDNTVYIVLTNSKEGITIQRIYNKYLGTLMTFDDDSINDEMADLIDLSRNDSVDKKQQYEAYQNWIKQHNITKLQVSNMLDEYYSKNRHEAVEM